MEKFLEKAVELGTEAGGKILVALLVYLIGSFIIKKILKMVGNLKALKELDASVFSFAMSAIKALLYIILIISIISVLGIPMASVIAVLASAGLAVGMALQGALGNLAGGIMLMIFKPFKVGDLVEAAGAVGIVKEITLFYTVLDTTDNRRITVPNGSLMNANVDNYTANATRRVDMVITCERGADVDQVQNIIYDVMNKYEKIL
ncbi:MAG: mechanosensitive ion channel, partial [Solobacterium sp.]|nr:mechanosensitive ion channel [Solobacterium sp.]